MTYRFDPRTALAAVVALLLLGSTAPVAAQSSGSSSQQGQAVQQEFKTAELESFAAAALNVNRIGREWRPRIENAADANEAQTLRKQAMDKMVGAIEDEGLTVDKYNAIAEAARDDDGLHQRIIDLIDEMR